VLDKEYLSGEVTEKNLKLVVCCLPFHFKKISQQAFIERLPPWCFVVDHEKSRFSFCLY
jgi:hypothetical protein